MEAFVFVKVKQREDDTQCSKMMLRFREDKIKRLESLSAGFLTAELYLMQEKNTLVEELQLLQAKIDRNPELTRFAMENIRLLEQLRRFADNLLPMAFNFTFYVPLSRNRMHRNLTCIYTNRCLWPPQGLWRIADEGCILCRFQDFYTGGEREAMADEISNLRDQVRKPTVYWPSIHFVQKMSIRLS